MRRLRTPTIKSIWKMRFMPLLPFMIACFTVVSMNCLGGSAKSISDKPVLFHKITIPDLLLAEDENGAFGGDIRIGDLNNNGEMELVVYRTIDGVKPCFIGAFNQRGEYLWHKGEGGQQPIRPGPVAIFDIDNDGESEVICFFHDPTINAPPESMKDVLVQILDGKTGLVKKSLHPPVFDQLQGDGPNWVHQRILIANLRGTATPGDFIVKLGKMTIAFDNQLQVLWTYTNKWEEYSRCPAYIPSVGDIDGDGKDEVNGGYFLLDDDGTPAPDVVVPWWVWEGDFIAAAHLPVLGACARAVLKAVPGAARWPLWGDFPGEGDTDAERKADSIRQAQEHSSWLGSALADKDSPNNAKMRQGSSTLAAVIAAIPAVA